MERLNSFNPKKFMSDNAIVLLVLLLAVITYFNSENFLSQSNTKNLIINMAPRFIIACGVSGCLITKGTDLSAGRQVGLAACVSAMLLQKMDYSAKMFPNLPDIPWPVAMLIVMAVMAVFGAINGSVIAYLKVPPFIATLGMQLVVYGICSISTGNQPMGGYKESYLKVASGTLKTGAQDLSGADLSDSLVGKTLDFIPYLAIFAVLVGVFIWFLYNKTRHGKYMYAIGGNESAAQVAGVNVPATIIRI